MKLKPRVSSLEFGIYLFIWTSSLLFYLVPLTSVWPEVSRRRHHYVSARLVSGASIGGGRLP